MANPLVNGSNFDWATISLVLFGVPEVGLTEIKYSRKQKKENNYGAGNIPVSRGYGNYEFEGSITMYLDVWKEIIKNSPNRDPLSIPPFDIPVVYGNNPSNLTTDVLRQCEFLEDPFESKQGDTKLMVTIPLIIALIDR